MNKFIVLSALLAVAAAAPEADPLLVYGLVSPHAKTAGLVTHANGAVVPTDTVSVQAARAGHLAYKGLYGYYGYPYAHHYLGKREAESKADADPYLLYGAYHHYPHITSVGAFTTYSNGAVTPTNTPAVQAATANHLAAKAADYAAHGYPLYHHYLGKRDAEADADPFYFYGHYPAVTSSVAGGFTTYANGAVVPTDPANLAATASHIATKAAYPWGYGGYGHYGYYGHPYAYWG